MTFAARPTRVHLLEQGCLLGKLVGELLLVSLQRFQLDAIAPLLLHFERVPRVDFVQLHLQLVQPLLQIRLAVHDLAVQLIPLSSPSVLDCLFVRQIASTRSVRARRMKQPQTDSCAVLARQLRSNCLRSFV